MLKKYNSCIFLDGGGGGDDVIVIQPKDEWEHDNPIMAVSRTYSSYEEYVAAQMELAHSRGVQVEITIKNALGNPTTYRMDPIIEPPTESPTSAPSQLEGQNPQQVAAGIDVDISKIWLAHTYLQKLSRNMDDSINSLSSIKTLDGVDDSGAYTEALKCLKGTADGGVGSSIEDSLKRTKEVRDAVLIASGVDPDDFDAQMGDYDYDYLSVLFDPNADIESEEAQENAAALLDRLLWAFVPHNEGGNELAPLGNGYFVGMASLLAATAKSMNPMVYAGMVAFTSIMAGSTGDTAEDKFNNALYALQLGLGVEDKANDLTRAAFGYAQYGMASIGVGSIILSGITVIGKSLASGKTIGEVIEEQGPQILLESTVWTIVNNCLAAVGTPPTVSNALASCASAWCTAPFKDADGNVDQGWCLAAEGGIVVGVAVGGTIVSAMAEGATVLGASAVCPPAAIILGCAFIGYCLVVGAHDIYQAVQRDRANQNEAMARRYVEQYGIPYLVAKQIVNKYQQSVDTNCGWWTDDLSASRGEAACRAEAERAVLGYTVDSLGG